MTVKVNTHGDLIEVVLDRPEKHNAFDEHTIATLTDAFTRECQQPGLRVCVLLTGALVGAESAPTLPEICVTSLLAELP